MTNKYSCGNIYYMSDKQHIIRMRASESERHALKMLAAKVSVATDGDTSATMSDVVRALIRVANEAIKTPFDQNNAWLLSQLSEVK